MTVREAILDKVKSSPGITASTLAGAFEATPNRVYILLRQMAQKGEISVRIEQIEGTRLKIRACYPA